MDAEGTIVTEGEEANMVETIPPHAEPVELVNAAPPIKQQSRAIQARWAGEQASEQDLEQHCRSISVEKLAGLYDAVKKRMEFMGKILNERANAPDNEKCATCGKTLADLAKEGKRYWACRTAKPNKNDARLHYIECFCSANCMSLHNNKTQGVKGLPDRGMLRSDNPKDHQVDISKGAV